MIRDIPATWIAAAALGFGCVAARAAPVTLDLGYTTDQEGGHAVDLDFSVAPSDHLTLSAGAGQARGGEDTGGLDGRLLDAGISVHGERFGAALRWDDFRAGSNYEASTVSGRAWVNAGDFEFALLARQRNLTVDVTLQLPLRTLRRELAFAGFGTGLQVTLTRERFNAYVMALEYDYDGDFDDLLGLIHSPQLALRPRIEALVASMVTQTQGAMDRQAGAGVEFGAGRHAVAVDMGYVHDAVLEAGSISLAVTYRRAANAHLDWALSGGVVDSDAFGDIGFLGLEIGLAN